MHGLIFETSVWLLAGSTRLISIVPLFLAPRKSRVLQRKLCKPKLASFFFKKYLKYNWIQPTVFQQINYNSNANKFSLQKLFPRITMLNYHEMPERREFTMRFFGVLFDSDRNTKQMLRHKHIRAIQWSNRIIQLCKA